MFCSASQARVPRKPRPLLTPRPPHSPRTRHAPRPPHVRFPLYVHPSSAYASHPPRARHAPHTPRPLFVPHTPRPPHTRYTSETGDPSRSVYTSHGGMLPARHAPRSRSTPGPVRGIHTLSQCDHVPPPVCLHIRHSIQKEDAIRGLLAGTSTPWRLLVGTF